MEEEWTEDGVCFYLQAHTLRITQLFEFIDVLEWRQKWRQKVKEIFKKELSAPNSDFWGCQFGVLPVTLKFGDFWVMHQTFSCKRVK